MRKGEEKDLRTNNSSHTDRLLIGFYVLITSLFLAISRWLVGFFVNLEKRLLSTEKHNE